MNIRARQVIRWVLVVVAVCPTPALGEVTGVAIKSRGDVLGGKEFGSVGAYETLAGTIYFAVDPRNPRNRIIVDLDKAPRNAEGLVEFSADLFIITPKDPSRGNGVLLFDVVNRGNLGLLRRFNRATASNNPTAAEEFGDGFLMREGYTLVVVGWEHTPRGVFALNAPIATDSGHPIIGTISNWFIPTVADTTFDLIGGYWTGFRPYPPIDPSSPAYRLTERLGFYGMPGLIPRNEWGFGRVVNGKLGYDPQYLFLKTRFKPGYTYEVSYETRNPIIAGLGFAAIRDAASAFKYDSEAVVRGRYAYATGASQAGRYLRALLHEGFSSDERGRQALDAIYVHVGGAGFGSFNERFAQPNEGGFHVGTKFPFLYDETPDPATGKADGLGARVPPGQHPKLVLFESSSEYWDRGRVAALNHVSIDGDKDVPLPDNVRMYVLAGVPHSRGPFPPIQPPTQQVKANPLDTSPVVRGLLVALDRWVRMDKAPPPSKYPTLRDGTLVAQTKITFPAIPGVRWPYKVPGGYRSDLPGPLVNHPLPFLVPQVDQDGNESAGLRLPEQAVPLATYTGWGFRSERIGAPDELLALVGSYIPFARSRAERIRSGDPRRSITERYRDRAEYVSLVEDATRRLVKERYLLDEDRGRVVDRAGRHWDHVMGTNQ